MLYMMTSLGSPSPVTLTMGPSQYSYSFESCIYVDYQAILFAATFSLSDTVIAWQLYMR